MQLTSIILGYLKWHYSKAIISLIMVWSNFLFFTLEFFSIKLLFRNFFDPWKRMNDKYPDGYQIKKYFFAFISNTIIRIVGMIMRGFLIIIGLICYIILALLLPLVLLIWLLLPFITLYLIIAGIYIII